MGTEDVVFILRHVQEKNLEENNKRYWTFVDLKKAFDRVPREVAYWSLRRKGISEKHYTHYQVYVGRSMNGCEKWSWLYGRFLPSGILP